MAQNNSKMLLKSSNQKPFAIWIIIGGLIFSGLDLLYGIIPYLKDLALLDPFIGLVLGFVIVCFVSGLGIFSLKRRWSFILAIVVNLGFVIPSLVVFPNSTQFTTFVIATSSVSVLTLVAIFSILSLLNLRKGINQKKYLASPKSPGGLLTVAILIRFWSLIAFGALLPRGTYADAVSVIIVSGESNPSYPTVRFDQSTFNVIIGVKNTVTWINRDSSLHTVTSNNGLFDSGLLNSGDKWSYAFLTPGRCSYHCSIHP
jgi:hypothetical protein